MKSSSILLADGTSFSGQGFGASGTSVGEFVFHTGMTGYQEILTDPSYAGQMVTMTYPEIGNTGITDEDMESRKAWLNGFIVRHVSPIVSNWRSQQSLPEFLSAEGIVGITEVDTRSLTLRLREHGAMMGIISDELTLEEMQAELENAAAIEEQKLVDLVTTPDPYVWNEGTWKLGEGFPVLESPTHKVVALDFGVKRNILRLLVDQGCEVHVVPAHTPAEEVLALNPDGIFLSNGPGDPRNHPEISENIKGFIGKKPIFGICFGFQVLGPALGGQITKLNFGHHGANHPVKHVDSESVWITSQNHNYVVEIDSLPESCEVTDINLNDQTLEGFRDRERSILAIQYHPEASPGPHDAVALFKAFAEMMQAWNR